jgi:tRNA A-37 threonylcarbamoyl transferase component Bud32
MKHYRKILVPGIKNLDNFIDKIALCQSSDQLNAIVSNGEVIKKYRVNKPKTIIRVKLGNNYYYLKIRWKLNLWRTIKDLLQGNKTGCKEAKKYLILKKYQFKIPKLVAYGCTQNIFAENHSFQLTEEVNASRTIKEFYNDYDSKEIIKNISRLIGQLHENKFIYGSKQLHHDNILAVKNNEKIDLYLLDPIGLKKSTNFEKRIDDLMGFIYKNDKIWLDKYHVDLFLKHYYDYAKIKMQSLSFSDFTNQINVRIQKLNNHGERKY